jgi:hypothetical protein
VVSRRRPSRVRARPPENRDVFTVALDGSDLVNVTASNQKFDAETLKSGDDRERRS